MLLARHDDDILTLQGNLSPNTKTNKLQLVGVPAHWPVGRVFANGPGHQASVPGCVIPKT